MNQAAYNRDISHLLVQGGHAKGIVSKLNREEWIAQAARELVKLQTSPGQVLTDGEMDSFTEWATSLAHGEKDNYYTDGYTPADAAREELSYA